MSVDWAERGMLDGLDSAEAREARADLLDQLHEDGVSVEELRRAATVLVVEIGGKIAGYATIGKNRAREPKQQGEIYELYLRPEYQGIGLGSRLFKAARGRLADHGLKGMVVWALEDNQNALAFYAGAGGRDVAEGVEIFEQKALKKVAFVWE